MSTQHDLSPSDDEKSPLHTFKSELYRLANEKEEDVLAYMNNLYPKEKYSSDMKRYIKNWRIVSEQANALLSVLDSVPSTLSWKNYADYIFMKSRSLEEHNFSNIDSRLEVLIVVKDTLLEMKEELPKETRQNIIKTPTEGSAAQNRAAPQAPGKRTFVNSNLVNVSKKDEMERARQALSEYVEIGKAIVSDKDYKSTNLYQLDCMLADTEKWVTCNLQDMISYCSVSTSWSVIHLAAPSLEGKTQSAFTLRQIRPLYFPLSEANSHKGITSQAIYFNFKSHVLELYDCIMLDLNSIGINLTDADVTAPKLENIQTPFWTIGFLKGLVDRSKLKTTWMEHYVMKESFEYSPMTILEAKFGAFNGFCLFLDEFSKDTWTIFLKNLGRIIHLRCIFADKNMRVESIDRTNRASGYGGRRIWSIVLVRLNPPCIPFLNSFYELDKSIKFLKEISGERIALWNFLDDFAANQLKYLRPGMALYVARSIKAYADSWRAIGRETRPELEDFLDTILTELYLCLINRKQSLRTSDTASLAKIGLLYPESYYPAKPDQAALNIDKYRNLPSFLKRNSFLEDHLYYLRNPQYMDDDQTRRDLRNWVFFTVISHDETGPFVLGTLIYGEDDSWRNECTYAEPNELLTMLSCSFIPFTKSPMTLLTNAQLFAACTPQARNPEDITLGRNPFVVAAAVCIADASHRSHYYEDIPCVDVNTNEPIRISKQRHSLRGQSGQTFIQNLVENLVIEQIDVDPENLVDVTFLESTEFGVVESFLKHCRIPFLYSFNRTIPILKQVSAESDLYLEEYFRTEDDDQIDGRFPIMYKGESSLVVMNCKNWRESVGSDNLVDILEKTPKGNKPVLSLIFCNSTTKPQHYKPKSQSAEPQSTQEYSRLVSYCKNERINIFKVKKMGYRKYQVVPFFSQADTAEMITADPALVSIVFEMKEINRELNELWSKRKFEII